MSEENNIAEELEKKRIVKEYRNLLKSLKGALKDGDRKQIRLAFEMAAEAHQGMRRKTGEPYILHPLAVAQIVASEIGLGPTAVIAALLHDVVEDTELTLEDIQREFGKQIAQIVDGLTKIKGVFDVSSGAQAENFRKVLIAMAEDVRVILIKIADRLHNMRTLDSMSKQKQIKISSETNFLYAPIAHRLGLYNIKAELEDLAMKYLHPDDYKEIAKKLTESKLKRNKYINEFIKPIKDIFNESGMKVDAYGRPKSISSIYNKMQKKGVRFEEVYDLFAIRIIVDSPIEQEKQDCWKIYSFITDFYQPNPERLRDWISTPKSTGYEALHTTVMGPEGKWVEVQIRSKRMDDIAEKGFAAHWKYKEGTPHETHIDDWLNKVREMLNSPSGNALELISDFKLNLFTEEIYVFTPKGESKLLPTKSTALDFAFDIHTALGLHCIGAKVNHKLVPLSHQLKNGDQVEIITSSKQKPNEDWLNFVVTAKAKGKIKDAFKEEKKQIAEAGKILLEKKLKSLQIELTNENQNSLLKHFKTLNLQEFNYLIGLKKIDLSEIDDAKIIAGKIVFNKEINLPQQHIDFENEVKQILSKNAEITIFGDNDTSKLQYSLAKCCNPIPGDDVFGYMTATEGLKIHSVKCPNAIRLLGNQAHRVIATKWSKNHEVAFLTKIKITGIDEVGVMSKITQIISSEMKINIRSINIDTVDGIFEGEFMIYVNDTPQLNSTIKKLLALEGIHNVERIEK
jgi:GTP diphosphokinase / guanosine-3',5'-bis(diphosphate) 3'-diphosphatase